MADNEQSILAENLFFLTGALARKLYQQSDEAFASLGLSTSHALILMLVREEPGIQPSMLAEKLYLKPSTISRLVQKLERRELVECESEGRATTIACSSKGLDSAGQIEESWENLLDQKREELGDRYVEVLSEMISNALNTLDS